MINFTSKDRYDFADLQRLVEVLRAPGGCPWDGAQTHLSIRRNFLEEAYEACEGFDLDDPAHMREELGDVLLQVLFHTDIEREAGRFTLDDVCDAECRKLIFRHPALFGGEAKSWDEVKQQEKGQTTVTETLDGVARSLPATWRSEKLQKKAAKCGFAWESAAECLGKLEEEILKAGLQPRDINFLTVEGKLDNADFKLIRDYMPNLVSVDISRTNATAIPDFTFAQKTYLLNMKLPHNLKSIGQRVFSNCGRLCGTLELPASVTAIEFGAFMGCDNLRYVLATGNKITTLGDNLFGEGVPSKLVYKK